MIVTPECPYCGRASILTTGAEVYPYNASVLNACFYVCRPCRAWVGCHPGTTQPNGRLADLELRKAKAELHVTFDPIWKLEHGSAKRKARTTAYTDLARALGIPLIGCNIGKFDIEMCRRATAICKKVEGLREKAST